MQGQAGKTGSAAGDGGSRQRPAGGGVSRRRPAGGDGGSRQRLAGGGVSRRHVVAGAGAGALGWLLPPGHASTAAAPVRIGFQMHATGIGAAYGRWYSRVTQAAASLINSEGGINGRPVEIITEDDGTDPKRGAEVVEKFATYHKVDLVFGALFSHVVIGSAPRAGELKIPYLPVSEGYHVASGALNRYVFQPCITDVRSQVTAMAPWIARNLGKKITMIYPDFAFGHDHRDYFPPAVRAHGGTVLRQIPVPPTESSFTRYFPRIPRDTGVLYHVMVGPAVLTFVRELGQYFGGSRNSRPEIFGFIDSLEAVDISTPQLGFLEGTFLWEGYPRHAQKNQGAHDIFYRRQVGIDASGASISDPGDISTASHMFGCWETLFAIRRAMTLSGYSGRTPAATRNFIEAMESIPGFAEGREHPQGDKMFNARNHQGYGHQNISRVTNGRLEVIHRTAIGDGLYPVTADYTRMPL